MSWLAEKIARHSGMVVFVGIALWILAAVVASDLQLRTDLVSLLPEHSPAARAYREYTNRFHGKNRVFVIVTGGQESQIIDAAAFLAHNLALSPEVVSARAGLDEGDKQAFLQTIVRRIPILLQGENWKQQIADKLQPESIRHRVEIIRSHVLSPIPYLTKELDRYDPLGFSDLSFGVSPLQGSLPIDPLSLAFISRDGRSALVLVQTQTAELDSAAGHRLQDVINESTIALHKKFGNNYKVLAVGGPLYAAHDEKIIRSDLQHTLLTTTIACAFIIVLVFGSPAIPFAGLAALCAGLTWLAAGLTLTSGSVSAIALGFASILVGLGIDAVIHGGMTFASLRQRGYQPEIALATTYKSVSKPILTATGTTAGAFAVLLASRLPPLRELGVMVAGGMITLVLATGILGAALTLLFTKKHKPPGRLWLSLDRVVDRITNLSENHPKTILLIAAFITAATIFPAFKLQLDVNLQGLRPIDHPARKAEYMLANSFGITEDTLEILFQGKDLDEVLRMAAQMKRVLHRIDPEFIVISPSDRLAGPITISKRLVEFRKMGFNEASRLLRSSLRNAGLAPQAFAPGLEALEDFARGIDPGPVNVTEDDQIRLGSDGTVWASLTVGVPKGFWSSPSASKVLTSTKSLEPNAMLASVPLLGADLRQTATQDFRRLALFSLLLITALVLTSFRGKIESAVLALTPVVIGTMWTLGLWSAQGRSLDLVGLAVLPVLLGLGIDDGLYAVHGAQNSTVFDLGKSVRHSGSAMILTTITTCLGFGSLTLSHIPSLKTAGVLTSVGVATCLLITLTILPAITTLTRNKTDA